MGARPSLVLRFSALQVHKHVFLNFAEIFASHMAIVTYKQLIRAASLRVHDEGLFVANLLLFGFLALRGTLGDDLAAGAARRLAPCRVLDYFLILLALLALSMTFKSDFFFFDFTLSHIIFICLKFCSFLERVLLVKLLLIG